MLINEAGDHKLYECSVRPRRLKTSQIGSPRYA